MTRMHPSLRELHSESLGEASRSDGGLVCVEANVRFRSLDLISETSWLDTDEKSNQGAAVLLW